MERTTFRDPNVRFQTKDYEIFVGENPDTSAPAVFKKMYFIRHRADGVVAGHGNQLGGLIDATQKLQQYLDEQIAQIPGPPTRN